MDKQLDENIRQAFSEFEEIGKKYRRGLLSEEDFYDTMRMVLNRHFTGFLKKKGISAVNAARDWGEFLREYQTWKEVSGQHMTEGSECGGSGLRDKAGGMLPCEIQIPDDRACIFQLMEAFQIPVFCLESVPDTVCVPEKQYIHVYHGGSSVLIRFFCVDDGGLLQDVHPEGKTFTLISSLGLQAVVRIVEKRLPEQLTRAMDRDDCVPVGEYYAEGTIEGYTASGPRSSPGIVIRTDHKGHINALGFREVWGEDDVAFRDFEMWQNYFQWAEEHERVCKKAYMKLFRTWTTDISSTEDPGTAMHKTE